MMWPYLLGAFMLGASLGLLVASITCAAAAADEASERAHALRTMPAKLDEWEDRVSDGYPLSRADQLGLIRSLRYYLREYTALRAERGSEATPARPRVSA